MSVTLRIIIIIIVIIIIVSSSLLCKWFAGGRGQGINPLHDYPNTHNYIVVFTYGHSHDQQHPCVFNHLLFITKYCCRRPGRTKLQSGVAAAVVGRPKLIA
jgi:hypothetical protein